MKVNYVHIAHIEYTDKAINFVIENLTLSGHYLFLNIVFLEVHNHHEFMFTFEQMQANICNVAFYFKKKTVIQMAGSGLVDIVLVYSFRNFPKLSCR